ncbi:MAG: carboxypeptidase [Rhizobiales bacterium]|nr:carboxypeptidase [Hyphomicrobiales bacterium]
MTAPAIPGLTRALAALLLAAAMVALPQAERGALAQKAQQEAQQKAKQKAEPGHQVGDKGALRLLPPSSVTHHDIVTDSGPMSYTATAGTLSLHDQSGERVAAVFYIAYVADKTTALKRPVTFVFNGGPGAASAYLHLGLAGPRIAEFRAGRERPPHLHDNRQTWLQFTDLVMIDPVGSGFSRAVKADGGKAFWSVARDAEALAKVIALWVADNHRADSPKHLLGESYGGFRAAKVARALRSNHGIAVAGMTMVSPLMEGAFTFGGTRFALGAALQLPSLAAANLERKGAFTPERLAEAERFALGEYLTTLAGPPPRGDTARAFYARVAEITGMPLDVVTRTRGFIRDNYVKHLRAGEGLIVSRYDATFTGPDPHPDRTTPRGPDPLLDRVSRAYSGAMAVYVREELGYKTDMTYVLLSGEANDHWDWGRRGGRDNASVDDDLRTLLSLDPSFRLMVVHGYTDMVTPYSVSRYLLDHLPDFPNPSRAQLKVYRGGHMFYIDDESRTKFTRDARSFYTAEW